MNKQQLIKSACITTTLCISAFSSYQATVDQKYTGTDGATVGKVKMYKSITAAVNNASSDNPVAYTIYIKNGKYYEKIEIVKPFISFIGASTDSTILTYDLAQGSQMDTDTSKTWGNKCATLMISAPNFSASTMTIENGFDYNTNEAKSSDDPTKNKSPQALAVRTAKGSNQAFFKNCKITGYQDPLFADAGTQYYKNCIIAGNVDFVYGGGQAAFESCTLLLRNRNKSPVGYVTAPCTQKENLYGLVFFNCAIKRETPDVPKGSVFLGRPWHPTVKKSDGTKSADSNAVGSAVFINCHMDDIIKDAGYDGMSGKDKDGNKIWFSPDKDGRFFEFKSSGPGAISNPMRKVLSNDDAKKYTVANVLGGWIPEESVVKDNYKKSKQ